MPEYIGGKKVSDASIGGKKVTKKYRGPNLFYSIYLPVGTVLWNGNHSFLNIGGYAGQTPAKLTQGISKTEHGITINLGNKIEATYYSSTQPKADGTVTSYKASVNIPKGTTGNVKIYSPEATGENAVYAKIIDDTHVDFLSPKIGGYFNSSTAYHSFTKNDYDYVGFIMIVSITAY